MILTPLVPDDMMTDGINTCMRCGLSKNYHEMKKEDGSVYVPCVRKKPYKLADGTDIRLHMQVWFYRPNFPELGIQTGMVKFIREWGNLSLWNYPENREYREYICDNGKKVSIPTNLGLETSITGYEHCFSTLEGAEKYKRKCEDVE